MHGWPISSAVCSGTVTLFSGKSAAYCGFPLFLDCLFPMREAALLHCSCLLETGPRDILLWSAKRASTPHALAKGFQMKRELLVVNDWLTYLILISVWSSPQRLRPQGVWIPDDNQIPRARAVYLVGALPLLCRTGSPGPLSSYRSVSIAARPLCQTSWANACWLLSALQVLPAWFLRFQ